MREVEKRMGKTMVKEGQRREMSQLAKLLATVLKKAPKLEKRVRLASAEKRFFAIFTHKKVASLLSELNYDK